MLTTCFCLVMDWQEFGRTLFKQWYWKPELKYAEGKSVVKEGKQKSKVNVRPTELRKDNFAVCHWIELFSLRLTKCHLKKKDVFFEIWNIALIMQDPWVLVNGSYILLKGLESLGTCWLINLPSCRMSGSCLAWYRSQMIVGSYSRHRLIIGIDWSLASIDHWHR